MAGWGAWGPGEAQDGSNHLSLYFCGVGKLGGLGLAGLPIASLSEPFRLEGFKLRRLDVCEDCMIHY